MPSFKCFEVPPVPVYVTEQLQLNFSLFFFSFLFFKERDVCTPREYVYLSSGFLQICNKRSINIICDSNKLSAEQTNFQKKKKMWLQLKCNRNNAFNLCATTYCFLNLCPTNPQKKRKK